MTFGFSSQISGHSRRRVWTLATSAACVFALVVFAGKLLGKMGPAEFLRDPAAQYLFNPFSGVISYLGVFALSSTSVVCLFAARHARQDAALLASIGGFGLLLATDDLFLLHEMVMPSWLGFPEKAVLMTWGLVALAIGIRFRDEILSRDVWGLALALALLSGSVLADALLDGTSGLVVEDGLKFIGLAAWSGYWIDRAGQAIDGRLG